MANTTLSKGSTLKVRSGTTGSYTQVKGLKDFSGIGSGSPSIIETTDLDSTAKEKRTGLMDEGQGKFSFNYIATDPGQQLLETARAAATSLSCQVNIPDAGVTYTYDAFVLTTDKSGGVDKLNELSVTVEITGAVTRTNAV